MRNSSSCTDLVRWVDQHRHFRGPGRALCRGRPLLDQGRKLMRCSFGLPHIALRKAISIAVQNLRRATHGPAGSNHANIFGRRILRGAIPSQELSDRGQGLVEAISRNELLRFLHALNDLPVSSRKSCGRDLVIKCKIGVMLVFWLCRECRVPCGITCNYNRLVLILKLIRGDIDHEVVALQPCVRAFVAHSEDIDKAGVAVGLEVFRQKQRGVAAGSVWKAFKCNGQLCARATFDCCPKIAS
jgi:hypothetical protein